MIFKKIPARMCIVCREMKSKSELLRFVKDETGNIIIDILGKKQGRGAYICKSSDCVQKAKKCKCFERTFKMPVSEEFFAFLNKQTEEFDGE